MFSGQSVDNTTVLVKYVMMGDTDLSGSVNGTDYARIDSAYNNQGQGSTGGWFNGDFDYDGHLDGADYAPIDASFNVVQQTISQLTTYIDTEEWDEDWDELPGLLAAADRWDDFDSEYYNAMVAVLGL